MQSLDLPTPHNHVSQVPKINVSSLSIEHPLFLFLYRTLSNKAGITGSGVTLELILPREAVPTQVPVEAAKTLVPRLGDPSVLPTPTLATSIPAHLLSSL